MLAKAVSNTVLFVNLKNLKQNIRNFFYFPSLSRQPRTQFSKSIKQNGFQIKLYIKKNYNNQIKRKNPLAEKKREYL
jgi:cytochrome c-type biogenesis protein CcmE